MADARRPLHDAMALSDMPCRRCDGFGREPDWKRLGAAMLMARRKAGWSLRELGRRARVSASYASDLELGRRPAQGPGARRVLRLLGWRV